MHRGWSFPTASGRARNCFHVGTEISMAWVWVRGVNVRKEMCLSTCMPFCLQFVSTIFPLKGQYAMLLHNWACRKERKNDFIIISNILGGKGGGGWSPVNRSRIYITSVLYKIRLKPRKSHPWVCPCPFSPSSVPTLLQLYCDCNWHGQQCARGACTSWQIAHKR